MPIQATDKIWMDGELVPWDEARVHVLTHSLHCGSGVFEGIRTYAASDGPAVFRLTDLAGAVSGGVGFAGTGNLNPDRVAPSMFEPVHGSAPDIAGTGKADPRAAIISAAMMLEFLGEADAGARVRAAVDKSDDVQGSTAEIGDAIAGRV